jgi:hypothetical protein
MALARQASKLAVPVGKPCAIAGITHIRQPQHDRVQPALALNGAVAGNPIAGGFAGFLAFTA